MWKDRQTIGQCLRAEKVAEYEGDGDTNRSFSNQKNSKESGKVTGEIGDQRKN